MTISCGKHHFCALTQKGFVYAWCHSSFHQIEFFGLTYYQYPRSLSISNVKIVYCYDNMTFVITNDHDLYMCGTSNSKLRNKNVIKILTKVPKQHVDNVTCDGTRTFVLSNGKLYKRDEIILESGMCSDKFEEMMKIIY